MLLFHKVNNFFFFSICFYGLQLLGPIAPDHQRMWHELLPHSGGRLSDKLMSLRVASSCFLCIDLSFSWIFFAFLHSCSAIFSLLLMFDWALSISCTISETVLEPHQQVPSSLVHVGGSRRHSSSHSFSPSRHIQCTGTLKWDVIEETYAICCFPSPTDIHTKRTLWNDLLIIIIILNKIAQHTFYLIVTFQWSFRMC